MALLKFGGGVVDARGSMAGNTYSKNRFGNYMRSRTKPINPRSPRQMGARTTMMYLAEQWRESPMTPTIRAAWETYAASCAWVNKLGEAVLLTGYNMFIRANAALLRAGGAIVTAGPTALGLPGADPLAVCSAFSAASQDFTLTFDDALPWCDEDNSFLMIEVGQPQSPSRNYFNSPWRFCAAIEGDSITPPTSPTAAIACPAWTLIEGQRIFTRLSIVRADGRSTTKFGNAHILAVA